MKQILLTSFLLMCVFMFTSPALAHVVVQPDTVSVSSFQTFRVGVPNERDTATTNLRLVIPEGLKHISPNVKPGWQIEIVKEADMVTEIIWTGGLIPVGQRDEFLFSAQVPADTTTLEWRAYQVYADGTTVSWDATQADQTHTDSGESAPRGPLSRTQVINDLTEMVNETEVSPGNSTDLISLIALVLSAGSLGLHFIKRKW